MQFRIRDFKPGDFEELWRIDQECFAPGIAYSQRELAHHMRLRRSFTLVAEAIPSAATPAKRKRAPDSDNAEQRIVGFVVGQQPERGMGHIVTIDVVAQARRTGVGSELMSKSEDKLKAAGCEAIYLETAVDNIAALRFYKRHGYYVLKSIPRYYGNQVDALLLGKKLK
jgi:ribosomal-protein-alanine N-acetyltransferase